MIRTVLSNGCKTSSDNLFILKFQETTICIAHPMISNITRLCSVIDAGALSNNRIESDQGISRDDCM